MLQYMPKESKMEKEYIKVKPEGLSFHNVIHQDLKALITWFKKNFRSEEYRKYLKKVKPPFAELQEPKFKEEKAYGIKREKMKEEAKIKQEYYFFN